MKLSLFDNGVWDVMDPWNSFLLTDGRDKAIDNCWSSTEDGYSCRINMAGIKKENIKVLVDGRLLRVSAEQGDHKYKTQAYLPKKAEAEAASVKYEDGMLTLDFKKKESHKSIELEVL